MKIGLMKFMDNLQCGRSLYLTSGMDAVTSVLIEMKEDGQQLAFTSFQLPEHPLTIEEMVAVIELAQEYEVQLIPDIAHETLTQENIEKLSQAGLSYIRLDEFLDEALLQRCAASFTLVVNASTLQKEQLLLLRRYQPEGRVIACHNYYPKAYTGLSLNRVAKINHRLHEWGVTVMAFIPGDEPLRGPLHEGLPTVEEHRHCDKRLAIIQLMQSEVDWILVGDSHASRQTRLMMRDAQEGVIRLKATVPESLEGRAFFDRVDASDYLFRVLGTRNFPLQKSMRATPERLPGEIYQANEGYGRYMGEIEIVKKWMPHDKRQQKIGELHTGELAFLQQLPEGMGIIFER